MIEESLHDQALLEGPARVDLTFHVQDSETPAEAVERALLALAKQGADSFYFVVTDEANGEKYLVREGMIMDPQRMLEEYGDEAPAGT